jgi:hypothetical protein
MLFGYKVERNQNRQNDFDADQFERLLEAIRALTGH